MVAIAPTKMVMTGGWCLWHCLTDMNRDFWDLLNIIFMMLMMIMIIIITTNTILFYFYYYYYCYNQLLGPIVISGWFYTHLTPMNHAANFTKSPRSPTFAKVSVSFRSCRVARARGLWDISRHLGVSIAMGVPQ